MVAQPFNPNTKTAAKNPVRLVSAIKNGGMGERHTNKFLPYSLALNTWQSCPSLRVQLRKLNLLNNKTPLNSFKDDNLAQHVALGVWKAQRISYPPAMKGHVVLAASHSGGGNRNIKE